MPGKAKDRVAVLTGIHPTPCTTPFGDYYMSLQVTVRALPDVCHSTLAAALSKRRQQAPSDACSWLGYQCCLQWLARAVKTELS